MAVRRLQPRIARHLIGMTFKNFSSSSSALFGVEEGIPRGLWPDSSPIERIAEECPKTLITNLGFSEIRDRFHIYLVVF